MNLQKLYGFSEPFRFTGRWAVCIINNQYSQNQISDCLKVLFSLCFVSLLSRRKCQGYSSQLVCESAGHDKVTFLTQ